VRSANMLLNIFSVDAFSTNGEDPILRRLQLN